MSPASGNLAVVSVIGRDQKGVVARVSTYLASCNTNIEDIEQRVVEGLFIMTMLVDLSDVTLTLDEVILGLKQIGTEMQLDVSVRLHGERLRKRIALLVSREPHCLHQLLADQAAGLIAGDFICVLSNHEVLRPIAEQAGIPFEWMPSTDKPAHMAWLLERLRAQRPDLVVLARYMQVLSPELCRALSGRCINIHHSFLPGFKGAGPYTQAFNRGVKLIGATAHYVTADLDEGPIIAQSVEPARHADTPDMLAAIGRDTEARVLAQAVKLHTEGRIFLNGAKTVIFD